MRLPSTLSAAGFVAVAAALVIMSGCATATVGRGWEPRALLDVACSPGAKIIGVEGGVWLKAQSKSASGQFPAQIRAEAPDQLQMEVTNLIGGQVAVIRVNGSKFDINLPEKGGRSRTGYDSWGGIPLRWATDLFLGRIPCPPTSVWKSAEITVSDSGELVVQTFSAGGKRRAEKFVYGFRSWAGKPWAERLRWERLGASRSHVDFRFDDPEDESRSPRKWEAVSEQGEVKVRWKDRKSRL